MSDHSPLIADGDQYDSAPGIVHSLSEPCGGNIANHKHTLKKIWRRPSLHRDTHPAPAEAQIRKDDSELETTHSTHRSEIWYELFYDLIYVASATQLSKLVEHDLSLFGLFQSTLLFVVLRSNWEQLMFYQNRFDTKDLLHYAFYLFEAICAFLIAEHFTIDEETMKWDRKRNMKIIAYVAATARVGQSLMYMQVMYLTKRYRNHLFAVSISQRISAAIYLLSALLPYNQEYYYLFWIMAELSERSAVMVYIKCFINAKDPQSVRAPWHFEHLIHREGTFMLLILGEAIILLVQRESKTDPTDIVFGILSFSSIFNIGDLYYQQQVVGYRHFRETKTKSPSYLWIEAHQVLSVSMLFFGAGINLVYERGIDKEQQHRSEEMLMCTSAAVSLLLIYTLRVSYRGIRSSHNTTMRALSYAFRFVASAFIFFIPFMTTDGHDTILVLFATSLLLILQDLATHLTGKKDVDDGRSSISSEKFDFHHHNTPLLTPFSGNHGDFSLKQQYQEEDPNIRNEEV